VGASEVEELEVEVFGVSGSSGEEEGGGAEGEVEDAGAVCGVEGVRELRGDVHGEGDAEGRASIDEVVEGASGEEIHDGDEAVGVGEDAAEEDARPGGVGVSGEGVEVVDEPGGVLEDVEGDELDGAGGVGFSVEVEGLVDGAEAAPVELVGEEEASLEDGLSEEGVAIPAERGEGSVGAALGAEVGVVGGDVGVAAGAEESALGWVAAGGRRGGGEEVVRVEEAAGLEGGVGEVEGVEGSLGLGPGAPEDLAGLVSEAWVGGVFEGAVEEVEGALGEAEAGLEDGGVEGGHIMFGREVERLEEGVEGVLGIGGEGVLAALKEREEVMVGHGEPAWVGVEAVGLAVGRRLSYIVRPCAAEPL
jgi:hypothetical protein